MLAVSHAIAGAAIAAHSPTPLWGFAFAILSHPLLDLVPHWDFNTRYNGKRNTLTTIFISLSDAGLGFLLGLFFFSSQVSIPVLLLTMFLAQLPDWLEAPYHVFNWKFPPFTLIKKTQHIFHYKLNSIWGIIIQIAFILLLIS